MNVRYIRSGDYFIPNLKLVVETLISQMQSAEGITEALKSTDPIGWTQCMNNITARAEENIREGLIYNG